MVHIRVLSYGKDLQPAVAICSYRWTLFEECRGRMAK